MSPIRGLTERKRMPRIAKIRLGIKKANAKGVLYPVGVDYFVFPEEYLEIIKKLLGTDKPRELPIVIPTEEEARWADQHLRQYSQTRGLVCKGDGENAMRLVEKAGAFQMDSIECEYENCQDYIDRKCQEVMMLQFILDLKIPGELGIWQLDTGSKNAILNINSAAEFIRLVYGHVAMVPLKLVLETTSVKTPEGKQRTLPILNLKLREDATVSMADIIKKVQLRALPQGQPLPEEGIPEPDETYPEMIARDAQAPAGEEPPPEIDTDPAKGKPKVRKPRARVEPTSAPATAKEPVKQEPPSAAKEPAKQEPAKEPAKKSTKGKLAGQKPLGGQEPEDPDWTALKERQAKDGIQNWDDFFAYAFRIQAAGGATRTSVDAICGCLGVKQISEYKGTKEDALKELAKLNGVADWRKL